MLFCLTFSLTNINKSKWLSGTKGELLDTFVSNWFLNDVLLPNGYNVDEQEAINVIKDVISQYPEGITKKDIENILTPLGIKFE